MKKSSTLLAGVILLSLSSCNNTPSYSIHNESQLAYLNDTYDMCWETAKNENSKPLPIKLTNLNSLISSKEGNDKSRIIYSENSDLSNPKYVSYNESDNGSCEIYNVKIHTTYYYQVEGSSKIKSFYVKDKIWRNLDIDNVTNARDLGGYPLIDGGYVKQGVIYRSAKLTEDETGNVLISEKGIDTMVNDLGIKSEIDLRATEDNENGGITESALGEGVTYFSLPFASGGNYLGLNTSKLANFFDVLANDVTFPVDIHCSIGTDRTGVVCFLINALVGVAEEYLYRDYLFSNFANIGRTRSESTIDDYMNKIARVSSKPTLKERTYEYLVSLGVDSKNLDFIVNTLTEK